MIRAWLALALLLAPAACLAQTGGDFDLSWTKMSAGGTVASGGSFALAGTVAQIDASSRAQSANGEFRLYSGLWHPRAGHLLMDVPDPVAPGAAHRFDLGGFGENPLRSGSRRISFSLAASSAPVRLDVVDVTGRIVFTRSWDALGPGAHEVDLGSARVDAGVYWLRLTQAPHQITRKVVILN